MDHCSGIARPLETHIFILEPPKGSECLLKTAVVILEHRLIAQQVQPLLGIDSIMLHQPTLRLLKILSLREAVRDAGVLGLYFPGSPLWELRRKLREHGLYAKASHFWESIKLRWDRQDQMCSTSAMTMYLQADEIGGLSTTWTRTSRATHWPSRT